MKLAFNYEDLNFEFEKKDMNIYVIRKVMMLLMTMITLSLLIVAINAYHNGAFLIYPVIASIILMINLFYIIRHLLMRNHAKFVLKKKVMYLFVESLFIRKIQVLSIEENKQTIKVIGNNEQYFFLPINSVSEDVKAIRNALKS